MAKSLKEIAVGIEKVEVPTGENIPMEFPKCFDRDIRDALLNASWAKLNEMATYMNVATDLVISDRNLSNTKKIRQDVHNIAAKFVFDSTGLNPDEETRNLNSIITILNNTPTCEDVSEFKFRKEKVSEEEVNNLLHELSFSKFIPEYKK